jgi:hypothetical protein
MLGPKKNLYQLKPGFTNQTKNFCNFSDYHKDDSIKFKLNEVTFPGNPTKIIVKLTKPELKVYLAKKVFVSKDFDRKYLDQMTRNAGDTVLFPNTFFEKIRTQDRDLARIPIPAAYLQEIIELLLQKNGYSQTGWNLILRKESLLPILMSMDRGDKIPLRKFFREEIDSEVLLESIGKMFPGLKQHNGKWTWVLIPQAQQWIQQNTTNAPDSFFGQKKLVAEVERNPGLSKCLRGYS